MSVKRYFLDTNILIYSIDKQAGERHEKARHLMQEMMLETAVQAGVTHLYSEDMQHKQSWKNMLIENPFMSDF